jgi:RHS repeat-associated protein
MGLKTSDKIISGPMPTPATNRRAVNTFNAADRLTSAQVGTGTNRITETYLYNGCGALTNIAYSGSGAGVPPAVFTYDLAQRMTTATASNLTLSASYDALGNRIKTTVNGATSLWVIDHTDPLKRPLVETDTNGSPVRYYIWGAGRLLAVIDADGTTRYAHCDEQGSVVALTGTNGAVLFTASYGPYGEPWGATGTNATPFGWLGGHGVFHANGHSLYLTRHRAYDTTLKRFLSQDPIGLGGGANLYGYALGNPLSYIDPFGLCADYQSTIDAVKQNYDFGNPLFNYLAALMLDWVGQSRQTQLDAQASGLSPATAYNLGAVQAGAGGAFASATISLTGLACGEFLGSASALIPVAGGVGGGALRYGDNLRKTDLFHNFPYSFDSVVLQNGARNVVSKTYSVYTQPGSVNGIQGVYEVGVNQAGVITHRMFNAGVGQ